MCDSELAEDIGVIKPYFSDEALRREIIAKIEEHIARLKEIVKAEDWKPLLTMKYSSQT